MKAALLAAAAARSCADRNLVGEEKIEPIK
jgi:hypothetical protein